jgi:hypothetical protein
MSSLCKLDTLNSIFIEIKGFNLLKKKTTMLDACIFEQPKGLDI